MKFNLASPYSPTGDQPQAIEKLTRQITEGIDEQVLLGVTGSGKTFTMANTIANIQRPALIISHNKTLAAQLYQEFKEYFPNNHVYYFVSYYDYYQPEAYLPQTDTYIEKDAKINEEIDRLRHEATQGLLSFDDVIIIASVSCIYGLGSPKNYLDLSLQIKRGQEMHRQDLLRHMVDLQYSRNDVVSLPGTFMVRGESVEISSPSDMIFKIDFFGNEIEKISILKNNLIKTFQYETEEARIFPAKQFISPKENTERAIKGIKKELKERLAQLKKENKLIEYQRLNQRANYDLEMLKETGYCNGIENYSRHIDGRSTGEPPFTLIDYFNLATKDNQGIKFLTFIDESHMSLPQIRGMFYGDRSRKTVLVEHGFRLLSALDNRPLIFKEFKEKIDKTVYVSATPADYEVSRAIQSYDKFFNLPEIGISDAPDLNHPAIVQQLIRPTGILDPVIEIKPAKRQIQSLIKEIKETAKRKERALVTTLTKRLAEDVNSFLEKQNIKSAYMHSEIKTMERPEILKNLREGKVDVLVGINLLREGLDLPEVALVAILDADQEGFLRNSATLIQTMGRAARHPKGRVIMYADKITNSMRRAIEETERRRMIQAEYNEKHNIVPQIMKKEIKDLGIFASKKFTAVNWDKKIKESSKEDLARLLKKLQKQLQQYSKNMEFEEAAKTLEAIQKITQKLKK